MGVELLSGEGGCGTICCKVTKTVAAKTLSLKVGEIYLIRVIVVLRSRKFNHKGFYRGLRRSRWNGVEVSKIRCPCFIVLVCLPVEVGKLASEVIA